MCLQQRDTGIPRWMLDSGASNHHTGNRDRFAAFNKIKPIHIETACKIIYGEGIGDVILELACGTIRIPEVIYVPQMVKHTSLRSVGQLEVCGLEFTIKREFGTYGRRAACGRQLTEITTSTSCRNSIKHI